MNRQWLKSRLGYTLCLLICFGGITLATPRQESTFPKFTNVLRSPAPLSLDQLQQIAKTITVKISAKELLGSGTLLQRQGQIYTVITNAHVLRTAKPPYQIQTPDGRVYQASVLQVAEFQDEDLAVLQFRSPNLVYTVANAKDVSSLQVGDEVFVGGFTSNLIAQNHPTPYPLPRSSERRKPPLGLLPASEEGGRKSKNSFVFTSGKVTLLLDKALEQGYQIGYTNDVRKGMSGAPLINRYGEVVGINSLHKDPVWDTPEVYQDGSQPEPRLQELITQSSMAVPIKKQVLQNHRENQP